MTAISLSSIRRYPVKSMGGEALAEAVLDERGLSGDRWYAVVDEEGRLASGKDSRRFRRRDAVFDHAARTTPSGAVEVSGLGGTGRVGDPALDAVLGAAMGVPVRVLPEAEVPHQDGGGVSLVGTATLDWCAERWQIRPDPRRLRVNLVVATTEPFLEESWVGREVTVGSTRLAVRERVPRCRMIDLDQDGALADGRWLRPLSAEREGCLAVYAEVVVPGTVRVGEEVRPVG